MNNVRNNGPELIARLEPGEAQPGDPQLGLV